MITQLNQDQLWELIPASVGAILGAAAAAIPAYLLARKSSKEILERDNAQRSADEKAKAFRAMTVLMLIANSIFSLRIMIDTMLDRTVAENEKTPNQRKISAVVGFSFEATERFDPQDLAILSASGDSDLATELMRFSSAHAAIISAFADYKTLKQRNHDLVSEGSSHKIDGEVVSTIITDPRLAARIRINDVQLESMILQLIKMIRDESATAIDLGRRFNAGMLKNFEPGARPHVDFSQAVELFPDLADK